MCSSALLGLKETTGALAIPVLQPLETSRKGSH